VDHVERYRLPKRLQEQEVENDAGTAQQRASRGAAGHAYKNVGLANQYNVHEGVDLFAPQRPTQQENKGPREGHHDDMGNHNDKEAKQRRKEERQRKRDAKEKRRREREAEREQMAERKRHKRSRQYGNDDNDDNADDDSYRDAGNEEKISNSRNADSDRRKATKAKRRKAHNRYQDCHHS
jgi:hypothetical protein